MIKYFFIFILFSITIINSSFGSDSLITIEGRLCHYNDEVVLYHADIENNLQKTIVIKMIISDASGNLLIEQVNLMKPGERGLHGSFQIPEKAQSGTYIMNITSIDKSSDIDIYLTKTLPIINLSNFSLSKNKTLKSISQYDSNMAQESKKLHRPLRITGRILTDPGVAAVAETIILQTRGDSSVFDYTLTDSTGYFSFDLPLYGKNILQLFTRNLDLKIELAQFNYPIDESERIIWEPYALSNDILNNSDLLAQLLIDYNYEQDKTKVLTQTSPILFEKEIELTDFVTLKSTLEAIKELVPLKRFKEKKSGGSKLVLLNTLNSTFFRHEPLLMVDGLVVHDIAEILNLDLADIKSFQVNYNPTLNSAVLGRLSRYGIFEVLTKEQNYQPTNGVHLSFSGIQN